MYQSITNNYAPLRLISKSITSKPGNRKNTKQILPNISRSIGNVTMKFGQLKERFGQLKEWEIFFFKNHAENEAGKLVPNIFFFFKKEGLVWGKSMWPAA